MNAHSPKSKLAIELADMGSFHVGGRQVTLTGMPEQWYTMSKGGQPVRIDRNGTYRVEQMYAQYFLVRHRIGPLPILFWHGGAMTGACWETTPDGRPGWLNHFLSRGWDCYLCDAVERGRSGYAPVPEVWPEGPLIEPMESLRQRFRVMHADTQFPIEHLDQLVARAVPRWVHTDDAILDAYLALLERTGPAVVVCHSQSGLFAQQAALRRPDLVRAVVALEPASVLQDEATDRYRTPTLIVMGDHIEDDARWPHMAKRIRHFAARTPSVRILSLPDLGHVGNSHMLMMDRNSDDIAGLVQDWLLGAEAGLQPC